MAADPGVVQEESGIGHVQPGHMPKQPGVAYSQQTLTVYGTITPRDAAKGFPFNYLVGRGRHDLTALHHDFTDRQ